ncbi:MAG: alpha/beta hydrolase, partial [Anaerolinea sp.]|nr:alpha/beta hydrolase [Anaerolinea sp.]
MAADLVLIPSPLVGPETWAGVASALGEAGRTCTIAELEDDGHPPYWRQHVDSVRRAVPLEALTVVLVAHSGAGPLLGAIAHELGARVSGLLFVDAGLP